MHEPAGGGWDNTPFARFPCGETAGRVERLSQGFGGLFPSGCDRRIGEGPITGDSHCRGSGCAGLIGRLVLEPVFEADANTVFVWFCARDAGHRTRSLTFHYLGSPDRNYYWVLEPAALLLVSGLGFSMVGFALDRVFNPRLRDL